MARPDNKAAPAAPAIDGMRSVAKILELVGDLQPVDPDERRLRPRYSICCKMLLTPIDQNEIPLDDESRIIVGKDLSMSGISFSHEFPISSQCVVIWLSHPEVGQFNVEAEIAWTRRTATGLFESGCRLIRKIPGHNINLRT
jgi:hypothetical protein